MGKPAIDIIFEGAWKGENAVSVEPWFYVFFFGAIVVGKNVKVVIGYWHPKRKVRTNWAQKWAIISRLRPTLSFAKGNAAKMQIVWRWVFSRCFLFQTPLTTHTTKRRHRSDNFAPFPKSWHTKAPLRPDLRPRYSPCCVKEKQKCPYQILFRCIQLPLILSCSQPNGSENGMKWIQLSLCRSRSIASQNW